MRQLQLPPGDYKTVLKVLQDAWKLHLRGKIYTGAHRLEGRESNNKAIIRPGSTDEQLIADLTEAGQPLRKVMRKVNAARKLDNPLKKTCRYECHGPH